jgi:hypothetical protein
MLLAMSWATAQWVDSEGVFHVKQRAGAEGLFHVKQQRRQAREGSARELAQPAVSLGPWRDFISSTLMARCCTGPFTEPVDLDGVLSDAAKVLIADRLCAEFGLNGDDCVAYGDSLSDKDLFAVVPVSVAVNSDRYLSGLATHSYVGKDLWDAYELVRHAR